MSFYTSNLTLNPIFQCIFDSEKPQKKRALKLSRENTTNIFSRNISPKKRFSFNLQNFPFIYHQPSDLMLRVLTVN